MNKSAKSAKEFLTAMLWIFENVGWCKNRSVRVNAKGDPIAFCLSGAYNEVLANDAARLNANGFLSQAIVKDVKGTSKPTYFVGFNDHHDTTKKDVLRVVRRAIRLASKKVKK